MNELMTFIDGAHVAYSNYLPGGLVVPAFGMVCGFIYGLYRFIRSFKYLYYYYIEHGEVLWWMDNSHRTKEMKIVAKTHKLNEHYTNFGYVGGIMGCGGFAVAGTVLGSIWPIVLVVGILTIPNLVLRHVAKEKRAKAIFQQNLQGKADGNA